MNYKKHTLRNGVRVLLAPMKDAETATVLIVVGTGSRYESKETNGLAHFLEHMFFKGTPKRPNAFVISDELDSIGGDFNAYTGKDRSGYYAKVDRRHYETALDVVSDIFLNAKFEKKEIEKERGPIIQELRMYEDTPTRHIADLFEILLYGDHPLGWEIIGTVENIRRVQRKDFYDYLGKYYVASNTVIAVAGNFPEGKVLKKIRKDFGSMRTGERPTFVPYDEVQTEPKILVKDKKTDQTQLMLGVRGYEYDHPDKYILTIMSAVLGGGMSSRLFMEIREKRGLAYSVNAFADSFHDTGFFATKVGVEHENITDVITIILKEYKRLKKTKLSAKELTKAKEYLKGRLLMGLESSDDIVEFLAEQEAVKDRIRLPNDVMQRIDTVTAADVKRVANDIFTTETLNLALIGPHKKREKQLLSLLSL